MTELLWTVGLRTARALARRLSPEKRRRWAGAAGRLLSRAFPSRRRAVESNLAVIGAFAGRRLSADNVFGHYGMVMADFISDENPAFTVTGRGPAEDARRRGRGVLFLTSHLGHWELGGKILSQWGWEGATAVYQPYRSASLRKFIEARRAAGLDYLAVGEGAASRAGKILREGGAVALLADRPFGEEGEKVLLCGKEARLPRGPFVLAARSGAAVVPAFVLLEPSGSYRGVLEEPLWPRGRGAAAVKDLLDRTARILEKYLAMHGEQWFCLEPVWDA